MRQLKVVAPELRLDPERALDGLDWTEVFGEPGRVEIEIGPGKGKFLIAAASSRPDVHLLGVDWANKYLRLAEGKALRAELKNVRFIRVDAKEFVHRAVPERSISAYYVFYPDPWPKKRHHKRRFFQPPTIDDLSRTLVLGGHLHVATDFRGYWEHLEPLLDGHADFERLPEFGGPEFPVPVDEPLTNFEAKYLVQGRDRFRGSWRRRDA